MESVSAQQDALEPTANLVVSNNGVLIRDGIRSPLDIRNLMYTTLYRPM